MYLEKIDIDDIKNMNMSSLKGLLIEADQVPEHEKEDTEGARTQKAVEIERAIKDYPVSDLADLEVKAWLLKSHATSLAVTDSGMEAYGETFDHQIASQVLQDIQNLKKKKYAEYCYGADIALHKDSPDFKLMRMIKACQLLRQAFDCDPRKDNDFPEKKNYLDQTGVLESMIAETPAKTPEGLKAKAMFAWDDFSHSCGASSQCLIEGTLENVVQFLSGNQHTQICETAQAQAA